MLRIDRDLTAHWNGFLVGKLVLDNPHRYAPQVGRQDWDWGDITEAEERAEEAEGEAQWRAADGCDECDRLTDIVDAVNDLARDGALTDAVKLDRIIEKCAAA